MSQPQRTAWANFFSRERKRLIRYVQSLISDAADRDSEDILQDVILNLFDKADFTVPVENVSAYVYQALRNRAVDYIRRRRNHDSLEMPLPGDTGLVLGDILADLKYDSASAIERKEINRDISRALNTLSDDNKAIVIATEIQGQTFQDLSEQWDIPLGTLLARKSRAMQKLREALYAIDPVHYSPVP
jgi:RNA polymerase sigma factor (sigma-70 family)